MRPERSRLLNQVSQVVEAVVSYCHTMQTFVSNKSSRKGMASIKDIKEDSEGSPSALQNYLLSQPLQSVLLRRYFLSHVFDLSQLQLYTSTNRETEHFFDSYFIRYAILCKLAANKDREIERLSHWRLVQVIELLKDPHLTREDLVATITQPGTFNFIKDFAEVVLDLAAGSWLMLSIGKYPGDISYDDPISWSREQRLLNIEARNGLLHENFPHDYNLQDSVKLPQTFTAAHLERIGGIEVIWTSNLADHLLLKDDDTKLMLFYQVSILELHRASQTSLLPKALVDETVRSISLLIPPVLGVPNSWFQKQQRNRLIDARAGICDRLNSSERQIDKFAYWRDRLVLLKRTFDDAEPRTVSQLWWDDRKKTQWFTFWVAVLVFVVTVFFGVVQSVASIVQAWASVQSLKSQNTQQNSG